ncbi:Glucose-6-phosphate isomerase, cytosolic 1 [Datura stramonium]|uniref:Glucose-6-phosphate isomerase n=1 Tax=Datura stramonium TaxID=4076 RepID=A0ABS8SMQ8_DATST|nr:Glucose-6-phosphate isomerase, cytosolic 1 [Datura stramonium]
MEHPNSMFLHLFRSSNSGLTPIHNFMLRICLYPSLMALARLPPRVVRNPVKPFHRSSFQQPDALAFGKTPEQLQKENVPELLVSHKTFSGNRPSLSILLPSLNAYNIGQLLAIYEHRVAVQGFVWCINSFDQWGVELGKSLATQVRKQLHASRKKGESVEAFNFSTKTLITRYLKASADVPSDPSTLLPNI